MKNFIIKYFPSAGKYKRILKAFYDHLGPVKSFAQHKEDVYFNKIASELNIEFNKWKYIDVGANHPTEISNTYLLYRRGMNGIIIEPNTELLKLFKFVRPRDKRFAVGCSNKTSMLKFNVSKTPVISSFKSDWRKSDIFRSYYVPVMRLDDIISELSIQNIFLISIDVEGLNKEVLLGAAETIKRSLFLCVEFDSDAEIKEIKEIIGDKFTEDKRLGCNLIMRNVNHPIWK